MTTSVSTGVALALEGIVKRFDGETALDGASLTVAEGSLHAVLGENGAGKTTLMRVAFGLVRPDLGVVRVHGIARQFATPADAIAAGVGMVHQHFTIVPAMTVAENVALGGRGLYQAREAAARVRAVGASTGLLLDPAARADQLSVGAQQRLEIVKALARDARLLILDEPGAVLSPTEAGDLLRWLRGWVDGGAREMRRSAVLVTHKLRDALRYADQVTVLRRGCTVVAAGTAALTEAQLTTAMLGEQGAPIDPVAIGSTRGGPAASTPRPGTQRFAPGPVVVRADKLCAVDARGVERVRDASFVIRAGELVGIAAVEGSGQHELLRLLAGRWTVSGGTLECPTDVAFIPEDRHRDALLLDASVTENVALRGAGARRGRVDWRAVADYSRFLLQAFDVRGGGIAAHASVFSGGNQQKLVVAREMGDADATPALVVAENPTRGLDVRAAAAVRARLRAAREAGAAVVVYSSDLDEVLALADWVLVVHDRRTYVAPADRTLVGQLVLGVDTASTLAPN